VQFSRVVKNAHFRAATVPLQACVTSV